MALFQQIFATSPLPNWRQNIDEYILIKCIQSCHVLDSFVTLGKGITAKRKYDDKILKNELTALQNLFS